MRRASIKASFDMNPSAAGGKTSAKSGGSMNRKAGSPGGKGS